MPDWILAETTTPAVEADSPDAGAQLATLRTQFNELVESFAGLEQLYREDVGWQRIGQQGTAAFSRDGRERIASHADLAVTGNALIKRGVGLRTAYVWGQGVTVTIVDDGAEGQDVNAVWQAFWDDPSNRRVITTPEAQARHERQLATRGEAFFAFPTDKVTGRVRVRRIPAGEIVDQITDPEDEAEVWYYKRTWNAVVINQTTGDRTTEARTTYYPALGYSPAARPKRIRYQGDTGDVYWDAPVRHVAVNQVENDWRGVGDVLAALPWARMDKEFLEDLAKYMRALTRILGQATAKNPRVAARVAEAMAQTSEPGGWAVTDPNTTLSLVSKSGAQIDADSSKPFASHVAAALEVPVTMLLSDPGVTGARATAETLDQPTELMAKMRRAVHTEFFRDVADYVIDQAALAPAGPLRAVAIERDGDRLVVELPEGDGRDVDVAWPEFDSTSLKDFVEAVAKAKETEVLDPVVVLRLLGKAFELDYVDDLIAAATDDDGAWIVDYAAGAAPSAGDVAAEAHRRGEDPASAVYGA